MARIRKMRNPMASLTFVGMLVLSVPLVAGFFGTLHPAFDSFAHFRVHLAVLLILCALPLLATPFRPQPLFPPGPPQHFCSARLPSPPPRAPCHVCGRSRRLTKQGPATRRSIAC